MFVHPDSLLRPECCCPATFVSQSVASFILQLLYYLLHYLAWALNSIA